MGKINFKEFESIGHELRFEEKLRKNPNMSLKQKKDVYFKTSDIWQNHLDQAPFLVKVFLYLKDKITG